MGRRLFGCLVVVGVVASVLVGVPSGVVAAVPVAFQDGVGESEPLVVTVVEPPDVDDGVGPADPVADVDVDDVGSAAAGVGVGVSGLVEDSVRGGRPALVGERSVRFGVDGGVEGDGGFGVRLVRPERDRGVGVGWSTLDAGRAGFVSTVGFGFELAVDGVPGSVVGGRPVEVPGRGPGGSRGVADLGGSSGWAVEFELGLFEEVLVDVGRVQFEVGLGCSPSGCAHRQVLPSLVDVERGVVVVEVPVRVLAAIARDERGNGRPDIGDESVDESTTTVTSESESDASSTTDPATSSSTTATDPATTTSTDTTAPASSSSDTTAPTSSSDTTVATSSSSVDESGTTVGSTDATVEDAGDGDAGASSPGRSGSAAGGGAGRGVGGLGFGVPVRQLGLVLAQGSGSGVYFGVSGAASGPQGDYSAAQVGSLASWQVGLVSGSAELSYEVPVPGPVWGHVPSLVFSYSSGRVDGLHSSVNTQPSTVGVGWSGPGAVITREVRGCAAGGGSGEVAWAGNLCTPFNSNLDGYSISFDGVSGPLVRTTQSSTGLNLGLVSGAKYWLYETQMASDLRVRRVEHPARRDLDGNGDYWVTWWEVTDGDGTLFVFGREFVFRPASSGDASQPAPVRQRVAHGAGQRLGSVQTVPVYRAGAGCPNNLCDAGVAWHLDQVIDTSGNMAVYRYSTEVNHYEPKVNGAPQANRSYERHVRPWYVDYGMRFGNAAYAATGAPPYRVVYDYVERKDAAGAYPDTPTDLDCGASQNCADGAPAFYSKKRLSKVSTRYRNPANGQIATIRSFVFTHDFAVPPGEGGLPAGEKSGRKLRLANIKPADAPATTFSALWRDNRVNHPAGVSAMQMARVGTMINESGGTTTFTYGQSHPPSGSGSCATSNTSNVRRDCDMYVAWDAHTGSGGWVWWHKWKVTKTVENAVQGGSDPITVNYQYSAPEWAYAGRAGLGVHHGSQCKHGYGCNVWNDFRGHRKVTVVDATGANVEHFFFTGMQNDRTAPTGNSSWLSNNPTAHNYGLATVTDPAGTDRPNTFELAGRPLGYKSFNASGQLIDRQVLTYATAKVTDLNSTAGRFINYPISYRLINQVDRSWLFTSPGAGTAAFNQVNTHFDNKGRVFRVNDLGAAGTGDDRTTFIEYASNTGAPWLLNTPKLVATKAGNVTSNPWGNWLSATAYVYDNQTYGAAPTFGRVTLEQAQWETNPSNQTPVWANTRYQYNAYGAVNRTTVEGDPGTGDDQVTVTGYNPTWGYVTSTNGPLGPQDNYTYTVDPKHGQPTVVNDPNGGQTFLTYDTQGRLKTVRPAGYGVPTTKYAYTVTRNGPDRVQTETLRDQSAGGDAYVQSWVFYDGLGRHIQTQTRHRDNNNTLNATSTTRYDTLGRVAAEIDPTFRTGTPGVFINVNWSSPNKPHRKILYPTDVSGDAQVNAGCKTGYNTRTVYYRGDNTNWESTRSTQCGLTTRTWDKANNRTTTVTDIRANTVAVTDAAGGTTGYTYDLKDQLRTVTDPAGNTTTYFYDRQNARPTRLADPDHGTIIYGYDRHGRLKTQIDARNVKLDLNWDNANRPLDIRRSGQYVSRFTYDPTGAAGQLATTEHWNRRVNGAGAGYVKQTHNYNTRQQRTATTWQIPGLPGTTQTINTTYRDSGAIDTITYPNQTIIDYRYNRLEQPDRVQANGTHVARWVAYNAHGQPTTIQRGTTGTPTNLNTTRAYDPDTHRLTNITTTAVQNDTYPYHPAGTIAAIKTQANPTGTPINQTRCHTYGPLHQLTRAWTRGDHNCNTTTTDNQGPDPYTITYTHNNIGSITQATGPSTINGTYTYPTTGQPQPHAPTTAGTHTYTYDQSGNRQTHTHTGKTATYEHDTQNRLLITTGNAPESGTTNTYNTDGDRVRRIQTGQPTTWYLTETYETTNTTNTIHITIAGQPVGSITNGTLTTTATDHLNTPTHNTSTQTTQHQTYYPYGNPRTPNTGNNQPTNRGYTNQTNDNNILYHYNARYYDPTLHQFTQPDTITPNPTNTLAWNRYTYTYNNPITHNDPTGHCPPNEGCYATSTGTTTDWNRWKQRHQQQAERQTQQAIAIYKHLDRPSDRYRNRNGQQASRDLEAIGNKLLETIPWRTTSQAADGVFRNTIFDYNACTGPSWSCGFQIGMALPIGKAFKAGKIAPRLAPGVRDLAGAGDELAQGGVYALRDPITGQVVRTGRTNSLTRRAGEHLRDPSLADFEFEVIARTDVYAQQRGLEQLAHGAYTPALNRIRPISPTNSNLTTYMDAADDFLSIYGGG